MFANIESPVRQTPSKSANIERLMSLQKSAKKLSDADILSFAAEASAMKRAANSTVSDENAAPSASNRIVAKRLFDINMTSKSALGGGGYTPSKGYTCSWSEELLNRTQDGTNSGSDNSDSEEDKEEELMEHVADRHFGQILDIVNTHDKNRRMKMSARTKPTQASLSVTSAELNTLPLPTTTTDVEPSILPTVVDTTATTTTSAATVDDAVDFGGESMDEMVIQEELLCGAGDTVHTGTTTATVTTHSDAAAIKSMVVSHILHVLNTGSMDEMLSLQSIGQVRALRVLTLRSAGNQFHTLTDLTEIGMNDKTIARFLKANAGQIVAKVQDGEL